MSQADIATDMILLFGMPRSGTTWVGKVFDSHPATSYRHEPDSQFLLNSTLPLLAERADAATYEAGLIKYCREKLSRCSARTCGKQPHFPKQHELPMGKLRHQMMIPAAKVFEKALGRTVSWQSRIRGRLVWKSIESLGRLGVLLETFPDSRGVVIMRDPRGYAASILRGESQRRFLASESIASDWGLFQLLCETPYAQRCGITLEQIQGERQEQRLAWLWVLYNQKAWDDINSLANGRLVRYEDLCAEPARGFEELFAFCGLDWLEQTQRFLTESTTSSEDSYYSVYKDPLTSANQWQQELSAQQADVIRGLIAEHPVGQWYLSGTSEGIPGVVA